MRHSTRLAIAAVIVAAIFAFNGCAKKNGKDAKGDTAKQPAAKIKVIATFYPLYEFARQVGGDRVEVSNLVPAGAEPHDWEPSPKQIEAFKQSDLLVYNGAGFEPWVDRLLAAGTLSEVKADAKPRLIRATRGLTLYAFTQSGKDGGIVATVATPTAEDTNTPQPDPHVWLDPVLAQKQVTAIADALATVDPEHRAEYDYRAATFISDLSALDKAYRDGLRDCDRRDVITSHAAFGYLAWRYGLNLIPITGIRPEAEPTLADVSRIAALAKERGVRYVFSESLISSKSAQTIASEAGIQTMVLNPLEGLTKEEEKKGANYLTVMRDNLQNLHTALGCR